MSETTSSSTDASTTPTEEQIFRERILEELRRLNRTLEKIADRVGGVEGA